MPRPRFLRAALGARVCYDGVTAQDTPREGAELERILGLPPGWKIRRQRMVRIGTGPGLELFEIEAPVHQPAAALNDYGLNHLAVYVDDVDAAVRRMVAAGGQMLSEVHGNSRYEDTPGNASVYARAPWGTRAANTTRRKPRPKPGYRRAGMSARAERALIPTRSSPAACSTRRRSRG